MTKVFGLDNAGLTDWSVVEDAVSYDRSDTNGGITQISAGGAGPSDVVSRHGDKIIVEDDLYGRTTGEISGGSSGVGAWSMTADSAFYMLNLEHKTKTMFNKLAVDIVKCFFIAAGADVSKLSFYAHTDIKDRLYTAGPTDGNLWSNLKQWLSANDLNISWILDSVVVYPNRVTYVYGMGGNSEWTVSGSSTERAKRIGCYVYHRKQVTKQIVYPPQPQLTTTDKTVTSTDTYSVDAGQVAEYEIATNVELTSLIQPVMVTSIPVGTDGKINADASNPSFAKGLYTIYGKDNKPITPAQWEAEGGSLEISISESDPKTIKLVLVGMENERLGPYRVAESDGSTDYPALYIVGSGYEVTSELVYLETGSNVESDDVVIDNVNISTLDQAYEAMAYAAYLNSGYNVTLSWSGVDPLYQKYADFDKLGKENQLFGRLAGSRVILDGRWWRVQSATISASGVSFDAVLDIRLSDIMHWYPTVGDTPTGETLKKLSLRTKPNA